MAVNDITMPPAKEKFKIVAGETDSVATFIFGDEDHTLGNSLRHVLMQTAGTEFCGYSIPHPSEPYVHLRLQTQGPVDASSQLRIGLQQLALSCDHLETMFDAAMEEKANEVPENTY